MRTLAVVAAVALALAACSPSGAPGGTSVEKNTEWVRGEFLKAEKGAGSMGELFQALREKEPGLYDQFIKTAGEEISKGKSAFEAGAAARPLYLGRFMELVKTANDDDVNELLDFSIEQTRATLAMDPLLCIKVTRGEADQRVTKLPQTMQDRELRLMARVLRNGKQDGPVAGAEEVQGWVTGYMAKHPEMVEGFQLFSLPSPTPDQARTICEANIQLVEGIAAEEPATAARLFRGTLALN